MAAERREQKLERWVVRLRRSGLYVLFALVLLIPKLKSLRQRREWNTVRVAAALAGVLMVLAAWRGPMNWPTAAPGVLLLLLAAVPSSRRGKSVDQQAEELGALVVLNGGRCLQAGQNPTCANLYVAPERWYLLDLKHRPLVEIPRSAVSTVHAGPTARGWAVRVLWNETALELHYNGFFAEHLARVAETTLCSQLQPRLRILK